jgi:hypothetical protein
MSGSSARETSSARRAAKVSALAHQRDVQYLRRDDGPNDIAPFFGQ